MNYLKNVIKNTPLISTIYSAFRNSDKTLRNKLNPLRKKSTLDVFTDIYKTNAWGGKDSASGPGSDAHQTETIALELQLLLRNLKISSILDIPCGDFHWMKNVDLGKIEYIGADIVHEIVQINNKKYANKGINFQQLNLIQDKLPKVDLVFCRDCLVHLSFSDTLMALCNICKSYSKFLLTTTFTDRKENCDIITGQWHPLNLEREPFSLPQPIKLINERCTEGKGAYKDKCLGLWEIAEINESITRR